MGRQQRNSTTSSRPQTPRKPTQQTAAAPTTKPETTIATTPRAPVSDVQQQQQQQQQQPLFTPRQQQHQQQQQQQQLLTPRGGRSASSCAAGSSCPGCVCACPCVCGARWEQQQQPPTTPRGTSGRSQLLRGAAKGVHKIGNAAISEFKRAMHEAEKLESAAGRMDLKGLMLTPRGGHQKQGGSASTSAGSSNASTACSTPRRHYGAFQQELPSPELALQRAAAVIQEQEEIAHEMKEVEKANIEQGDWISSYEAKGRLPPAAQNTAQRPQTPRSRAAEKSAINSVKELAAKFKRDLKTSGGWKDSETASFLKQEAPEIFRHSGNSYRVPSYNSRAGPPEQASCVIC